MDGPGPQSVEEVAAGQFPPVLQRRPLHKRADPGATSSDHLASIIVYLSALHAELLQTGQTKPGDLSTPRAAPVLKEKRLSRTGATLGEDFAKFGQRSDAGAPVVPTFRPAAFTSERPPGSRLGWLTLLGASGVGFLCAAAIFGLRPQASSSGVAAAAPHTRAAASGGRPLEGGASQEAGAIANQVLDAIQHGRLAAASSLLEEAHRRDLRLPGMSYQAALLAYQRGDGAKAEDWIDASLAANEWVPECLYLQANRAAAQGDYDGAVKAMEAATQAAPFSPRYFFFLAECLRRKGNPALALPQFKQALRCRPTTVDTDLILFKMHLAMIEVGNDAAFQQQLAEKLTQEPVPGDTLLLAAANAINQAKYPEAAACLRRAAPVLPPTLLRLRLRDYLFRAQTGQSDLAKVWTEWSLPGGQGPSATSRTDVLVDPATRGLGEADPSGW